MLELYHAHHSTCSQKVRLCLAEKGLRFKEHLVDLAAKEQLSPDYLAINPNGVVPTLIHDGQPILDSSVICEYLEEVFSEPPLIPRDPLTRAHMRQWLRYTEEVPTSAVRFPSFNMAFLHRFDGLTEKEFIEHQANVRPLRKGFFRLMGPKGFSDTAINEAIEQIMITASRIDGCLAEGPWLVGKYYTLADIVMAPLIDRMDDLGFSHLWNKKYRRLAGWYERIKSRPAFAKTFYQGTRLSEFLEIRDWSVKNH